MSRSGRLSAARPVTRSALDGVIARVTTQWKGDGQASVRALARFEDLPAAVRAAAEKQGYDNASADERIPGVTYKGQIYLIHENISSEALAEETLLHERVHHVLRGNPADTSGSELCSALGQLYVRMGGGEGLVQAAHEAGVDLRGLHRQAWDAGYSAANNAMVAWVRENIGAPVADILQRFVELVRGWLARHDRLGAQITIRCDSIRQTGASFRLRRT